VIQDGKITVIIVNACSRESGPKNPRCPLILKNKENAMLLEGTVINGTIVLDGDEKLPEGARVEVALKDPEASAPERGKPTLSERLLKRAGTVPGLPADMAEQHDHYIHGTPKR
jgi:hypothetical protein